MQEYIYNPLILYGKKFDIRVYVAVMSFHPLVAYICDEGLAQFCTVDYETPTPQNFSNGYMHLTNYSLNKLNENFVSTDEVERPNDASK